MKRPDLDVIERVTRNLRNYDTGTDAYLRARVEWCRHMGTCAVLEWAEYTRAIEAERDLQQGALDDMDRRLAQEIHRADVATARLAEHRDGAAFHAMVHSATEQLLNEQIDKTREAEERARVAMADGRPPGPCPECDTGDEP